ncbi:MAG: citrate:proton symporter [Opitutaceae bacterium]|nr:citrate:proton symporter [Opitutaceae bacterium]
MLSLIGLLTIVVIVALLLSGRITPIAGLALVPVFAALLAGFNLEQIGGFFNDGVIKVLPVVIMFIFAILYFGLMNDVGLFAPLISGMTRLSRGSIIGVSVATVIIAAIAHLDGSGASTFLITIPALLPLYRRLRMNPYLLLLLVGTSASIMNMVPWGGPIGRAGAVLKVDPTALWRPLIPLQGIALLLLIGLAVFLGLREKRRIASSGPSEVAPAEAVVVESRVSAGRFWFNAALTAGVITLLVWGVIPAGLTFMLGASVALIVNFPQLDDQLKRLKAHAPNALLMAAIILAAGSFLGILNGTGMLKALATDFVAYMPTGLSRHLHLVIGFFGVPLELVLDTNATYFALLPVMLEIVTGYGVEAVPAAYALIIGNIIGTFVSPFSPALWLALGLANLDMGKHIRYSLPWVWGFSLALLAVAIGLGIVGL